MSLIGHCSNSMQSCILSYENRGWKAHKQVIQSLCCYGDATLLLTASRAVKMWSLVNYSVIKVTRINVVFYLSIINNWIRNFLGMELD